MTKFEKPAFPELKTQTTMLSNTWKPDKLPPNSKWFMKWFLLCVAFPSLTYNWSQIIITYIFSLHLPSPPWPSPAPHREQKCVHLPPPMSNSAHPCIAAPTAPPHPGFLRHSMSILRCFPTTRRGTPATALPCNRIRSSAPLLVMGGGRFCVGVQVRGWVPTARLALRQWGSKHGFRCKSLVWPERGYHGGDYRWLQVTGAHHLKEMHGAIVILGLTLGLLVIVISNRFTDSQIWSKN